MSESRSDYYSSDELSKKFRSDLSNVTYAWFMLYPEPVTSFSQQVCAGLPKEDVDKLSDLIQKTLFNSKNLAALREIIETAVSDHKQENLDVEALIRNLNELSQQNPHLKFIKKSLATKAALVESLKEGKEEIPPGLDEKLASVISDTLKKISEIEKNEPDKITGIQISNAMQVKLNAILFNSDFYNDNGIDIAKLNVAIQKMLANDPDRLRTCITAKEESRLAGDDPNVIKQFDRIKTAYHIEDIYPEARLLDAFLNSYKPRNQAQAVPEVSTKKNIPDTYYEHNAPKITMLQKLKFMLVRDKKFDQNQAAEQNKATANQVKKPGKLKRALKKIKAAITKTPRPGM